MLIKLTCPNCGRNLMVPDSDAGLPALCNACGQRIQIPYSAILPATFEDTAGLADAPVADPRFAPSPASNGETFTPAPPHALPPRRPDRQWPLYAGLGAAFFLLMIGLGLLIFSHGPDPWVASHREQIVTMIEDANVLIVAGDIEGAVAHLNDVERLIDRRPIDDPMLRQMVERAAVRKQQLAATLADRAERLRSAREQALAKANAPRAPAAATHPAPAVHDATPDDIDPAGIALMPATAPSFAPRPAPAMTTTEPSARLFPLRVSRQTHDEPVSDEQIGRAIQNGVNWLILQFGRDHLVLHAARSGPGDTRSALDALCVYALMQSSHAIQDKRLADDTPFVQGLLNRLDGLKMEEATETYGRSLRIAALAVHDRRVDRVALATDAGWLQKAARNGAYTYSEAKDADNWDNSNSQYGLLGVWTAAEVGFEVPRKYWMDVEKHWTDTQDPSGSWGYREGGDSLPMTLAGLTSLFVCRDYLTLPSQSAAVDRPPFPPALERGLAWLEAEDRAIQVDQAGYWGYTLYGLERVGLASGYKMFGRHDWYRELAAEVLKRQEKDGSWNGGDEIDTSFALLFLARGRHPLLMAKLHFDGAWANRPRDVANLTRFAGRELERQLNWQVVSADRDWTEWMDVPILYLASHADPHLSEDVVEKLRLYIQAGGLLYLQADGGSPEFDAFAAALAKKLFPQYPLTDVPPEHGLYRALYPVDAAAVPLKMVSNGARALIVYSPQDLAVHWQQRASAAHPEAFRAGVNLFLYATGKSDLRNRLASPLIPEPQPADGGTVRVARLTYAGDWDAEPAAWPRFARWFRRETNCQIELTTVPLSDLLPGTAPLAHLTGAAPFTPSGGDIESLRRYVDGGGALLIDSLAGNPAFAASATQLLARAFPDASLSTLAPSQIPLAPLLPGMVDLSATGPALRPYALTRLKPDTATLQGLSHGRGRVIFTPLDLTSGLLGTNTWGILGYSPAHAQALLKNILLTAAQPQ